jgi:hypothetical protein
LAFSGNQGLLVFLISSSILFKGKMKIF